jgi:hypothetical protein
MVRKGLTGGFPSFRGAKRTRNLRIFRCAIAHLRFDAAALPRNDETHDAIRSVALHLHAQYRAMALDLMA